VGPWWVEPLSLRLFRADGVEAKLEPRVMSLLLHLAATDGRPVTREALVASVWEGAFVSADAVHGAISKLRRALEQGAPSGSAIETVPRVGYRLLLPVRRGNGDLALPAEAERAIGGRRQWVTAAVVLGIVVISVAVIRWRSHTPPAGLGAAAVRPLTSFPGLEIEPVFAPTSPADRVAFSWRGPSQEQWDIYVTSVGGGTPLRLTTDPATDRLAAWSPDAARIAFVRRSGNECSLWSVAALGGDERRLARCEDPADLDWAPDGRTLYFTDHASPDAPYRLQALDLAGGAIRTILDPPPSGMGDHSVAASPRGGRLAVLRSPVLGVEDLWILEPTGALRRITTDNLKIHGFDWLPDGRALVVSSNRGGLFSLWRVEADGGEPVWLGASGGDLEEPSTTSDGSRIAFEQRQHDTNLYRLELAEPSVLRPLVRSTRWDFQPALSSDGARLAFVSDRTGSSELWTAAADGSSTSQRTRFGGAYVTSPQWSPDGGWIVFDVRAAGNGDLWLLAADGDAPRRLTDTPASDLAPTWSRDGRSVLFASDRSGSWELWRLDVESGEARAITNGGGYRGFETRAGALVFNRADRSGLWTLAAGERLPRPLVNDLAPVDRTNWTIAGDKLVYVTRPIPDEPTLVRLDLVTGRRTVVGALSDFPFNSGLALSPDAQSLLLARTDSREADILWMDLAGPPDRRTAAR